MATVYYDNPNNSTLFTTCCDVAVLDHQNNCPYCGQDVEPKGAMSRHNSASAAVKRRWYGNYWPNHGEGRKRP